MEYNKNLKHYKKSMIDEYESHSNDTQHSPSDSDQLNRSNDQIQFQQLQHESTNKHHQHSSSSKSSSSTNQSGKKVYCICKTADTQRFMIGCDNCDDWFHGDCVGVSESFSKTIKSYFCPMCRFKTPSLKIKHKKKYTDAEIKQRYARDISRQELKEKEINKQLRQENERKATKSESKPHNQTPVTQQQQRPTTSLSSRLEDEIESSDNKFRLTSTHTYGKSRVSGEDIENFVSAIAKLGSDALTNTMASLQIPVQNQPSSTTSTIKPSSSSTSLQTTSSSTSKLTSKRQKDDDYFDENDMDNDDDEDYIVKPKVKKQRTAAGGGGGRRKKTVDILKEQQQPSQRHHRHHRHHSSRNNDTSNTNNNSDDGDTAVKSPKQCLGPGCTQAARHSSKYCSDECGLKLAKNRIIDFLRENPNESNRKCCADELNEKQLAKINAEIESSKSKLNELDEKHAKLDAIIERAKYEKINENVEMDKDVEETEIYCVTCGHTFNEKHALKHMERCFNKLESQAFFGSLYKSPEGQTLFCDYYNTQTKMYCKRLKVMCPEHEKEKKINENEVCGCPLYKKKSMFDDSDDEICLQSKRDCQLHFKWEKMRRAQIDLEKLRLWMKLDELYEQKRIIEMTSNNRNGLLSCMLHKTIACNS